MSDKTNASHTFRVTIYYEDTDFSGVVYHANYLKFFERAREHALGIDKLRALYRDQGIGFVVHQCDLRFRSGAVHGDELEIRSIAELASPYRVVFKQQAYRGDDPKPLVEGHVHLVCVDASRKLVPLPQSTLGVVSP